MTGIGIVYVVDDDPSMRDLIAASLQPAGLTVKTFPSAEQFAGVNIAADSAGQPSCLLLDLEMPGLSGLEFLEKRFNSQPPCPVIIVTARGFGRRCGQIDETRGRRFSGETLFPRRPPRPSCWIRCKSTRRSSPNRYANRGRPQPPGIIEPLRARRNCSTPSSPATPPKWSPIAWEFPPAPSIITAPASWKKCRPATWRTWCAWPLKPTITRLTAPGAGIRRHQWPLTASKTHRYSPKNFTCVFIPRCKPLGFPCFQNQVSIFGRGLRESFPGRLRNPTEHPPCARH